MEGREVVVVLGGTVVKGKGKWHTCGFYEGDEHGIIGDRLRVEAGAVLFKELGGDVKVIASGGIEGDVTIAQVIKEELRQLGVPEEKILLEGNSYSTFQQFKEVQKIAEKERFRKLFFLTNRYHAPRVKVILEKAPGLDILRKMADEGNVEVLGAEEILIRADSQKWEEEIKKAYETSEMEKCLEKEKEGIKDLKTGKYVFKLG